MKETPREELAADVRPLNDEERAWIRSLERVLLKMPRRLLMVECADGVFVVDRAAARGVDLEDGEARRNGVHLATVDHSHMVITGVSG